MKKHSLVILSLLLPLIFTSCLADYLNEKFGFTVPVSINYSSPFGNVPARKKVTPGTELTAQDLPKLYTKENEDENEFLGWFLDDNFSLPAYEGYIVNEDITLYAQWKYQPAKYSQNDTLYSLQFSLFNPDNGSYGFDEHIDPGRYFDSLQQAMDYSGYIENNETYKYYEYIPEIPDLNNYYVDYSYEPAKTIYIIEKRYYKTHFSADNLIHTNRYLPNLDNYTYNFYFTDYAPDLTQFTYTDGVNANLHLEDCRGLTEIPANAFFSCKWLKEITFPENISKIDSSAFWNCLNLKQINLNQGITEIGNSAFCNCISLESIELPDSVTTIESSAFSSCTSLKAIDIPPNITKITNSCFNSCTQLEFIKIPKGATTIEVSAFIDCLSLKEVYFPSSLTSIASDAFKNCDNLNTVYYEGTTLPADFECNDDTINSILGTSNWQFGTY